MAPQATARRVMADRVMGRRRVITEPARPIAARCAVPRPVLPRARSSAALSAGRPGEGAAASMFFIGYRAALAHVHNLTISQIQAIEEKALSLCAAHQEMPAVRAFGTAVATSGR